MEMLFSNIDFINNVLKRSKFIIDEFNEKLVNDNEYAHINIIRDIDRSIEKLKDIQLKKDLLEIFCINFKNQDSLKIFYFSEDTSISNKIKIIFEDIALLSSYNISVSENNSDVLNGFSYSINIIKKV